MTIWEFRRNIKITTDNTAVKPTRENIIKLINTCIEIINANNDLINFLVHFSGHGTKMYDSENEELMDMMNYYIH